MNTNEKLILLIENYCQKNGIKESYFGLLCVNDGKLYSRLKNGGGISMSRYDKIIGYIKNGKRRKNKQD